MILSNYDFHDIHSILTMLRAKPEKEYNAQIIESVLKVLSEPQIDNTVDDNIIRKQLSEEVFREKCQVVIDNSGSVEATQDQIDAQKQANRAVITSKTKSIEAMQRTLQITEEGKAAAEKAKWEQEREKAVAVTKAEQEREVARLAAEKAKFEKEKVIAEGQAQAEANRLKVAAGLTPQERAEWDYKTAVGIAQALADTKVSWVPEIMINGKDGASNTAMDAVGLNMLMDVVKKQTK